MPHYGSFPERDNLAISGAVFPFGIPSGTYPSAYAFRRFWDTSRERVAAGTTSSVSSVLRTAGNASSVSSVLRTAGRRRDSCKPLKFFCNKS